MTVAGAFKRKYGRGVQELHVKDPDQVFVRSELRRLVQGEVDPGSFLATFDNITDSIQSSRRDCEEIFDEFVLSGDRPNTVVSLCLLAMVGAYKLTTSETYGHGVHAYKKDPGDPSHWVWYALEELDVRELLEFYSIEGLKRALGDSHNWALIGMQEAIQRAQHAGSFRWIRICPWMEELNKLPPDCSPEDLKPAEMRERQQAFLEEAAIIMESAQDALLRAQEEEVAIQEAAKAAAAAGEEAVLTRPVGFKMAHNWLGGLVKQCPSIDGMIELVATPSMRANGDAMVHAVAEKLAVLPSLSPDDVRKVAVAVDSVPELRNGVIAAGLLRNSAEGEHLRPAVLEFVALCTQELAAADPEKRSGLAGYDRVMAAARSWFKERYNSEPEAMKPKVEEADDSWGNWGSGALGWGGAAWGAHNTRTKKAEPKGPTLEEIEQMRQACLREALECLVNMLDVPLLGQSPQGLLHELSQCHFLKGDANKVLQTLCGITGREGTYKQKNGRDVPAGVAATLTRRGMAVVKEAIGVEPSEDKVMQIVALIRASFAPEHEILHQLLHAIVEVTQPEAAHSDPALRRILYYSRFWADILQMPPLQGEMGAVVVTVRQALVQVAAVVADSSVTLGVLNEALVDDASAMARLLPLLQPANQHNLTQELLMDRGRELRRFDAALQSFSMYVNLYCSCGIVVEVGDLRATCARLSQEYATLVLREVTATFEPQPCMPFVAWLGSLTHSTIFLKLWRAIGHELNAPIQVRRPQREIPEHPEAQQHHRNIQELQEELQAAIDEEDDDAVAEIEEALQEEVAALERLVEEHAMRHAEEMPPEEEPPIRPLTQDRMAQEMLPQAKLAWQLLLLKLATANPSRSMSVPELEKTFSGLDEEQITAEIMILKDTGITLQRDALEVSLHAASNRGDDVMVRMIQTQLRFLSEEALPTDDAWAPPVVALLHEYHYLMQVRVWLPAVLKLPQSFQHILQKKGDLDDYVSSLTHTFASFEREWPQLTLRTLEHASTVIRPLFSYLSRPHMEFLSLLASEGPDLAVWLCEKSDTDQFNKLMQVARGGLDDARLLSAMASLVSIRTLLLKFLYSEEQIPYPGLNDFLQSFAEVELVATVDGVGPLADLENILASFDALVEVFEKQTRSAGVKACYDLAAIAERGSFVFETGDTRSKILVLDLAASEEHEVRQEPQEYLIDLRNNLMMTEVPKEVEEELGVEVLIGAYVLQLRALEEIADALSTLFMDGHFGYQTGYRRIFRFVPDGLGELESALQGYRAEIAAFRTVVKTQRESHYYLCFFTMREIILLWGMLREQRVADFASLMALVSSKLEEDHILDSLAKRAMIPEDYKARIEARIEARLAEGKISQEVHELDRVPTIEEVSAIDEDDPTTLAEEASVAEILSITGGMFPEDVCRGTLRAANGSMQEAMNRLFDGNPGPPVAKRGGPTGAREDRPPEFNPCSAAMGGVQVSDLVYTVDGAGSEEVNGYYRASPPVDGVPSYVNVETGVILLRYVMPRSGSKASLENLIGILSSCLFLLALHY